MWNGAADNLKAIPATRKTNPAAAPSGGASGNATASALKSVVPVNPYSSAQP